MSATSTGPSTRTGSVPARAWLPRWVLLALIWGCAFWFIKVAVTALTPVQVAFSRVSLGAAVLLLALLVTRTRLPRDPRVWLDVGIVALFLAKAAVCPNCGNGFHVMAGFDPRGPEEDNPSGSRINVFSRRCVNCRHPLYS